MDPNNGLPNGKNTTVQEEYETSEQQHYDASYVSPLHEMLRGTTAMPTLEQFQQRYYSSVMPPLPQPPFVLHDPVAIHPPPPPAAPFTSFSELVPLPRAPSLADEPNYLFTGLAMLPGYGYPVTHDVVDLTGVSGVDLGQNHLENNHAWFLPGEQMSYTHFEPTGYEEPYVAAPPDVVNLTNNIFFPSYPHIQAPPLLADARMAASSSAMAGSSAIRREYVCDLCNLVFDSSQAFGGHMSAHSKMKKKKKKLLLGG